MTTITHHSNRPLVIFFILSLAFVLLFASIAILNNYGLIDIDIPIEPFLILGSWTPNVAAFLVIAFIIKRPGGIRKLFRRWTMWKESPSWYLVALSPLLVSAIAAVLYHIIDGTPPAEPTEPTTIPMLLALLLIALVTGAMGEELGWRGFALPWLQTRMNALAASVAIGAVWGFWHFPLWFTGLGWEEMSFWLFTYNCIAISVVMTWVCNNTRGNMLLITLLHLFYNFGWNLMSMTWGVPIHETLLYQAVVLTVYASVILILFGPSRLSNKDSLPIDYREKSWVEDY
jgi:uncharacterized protein